MRKVQCFGPVSVPVHKVALCNYLKSRKTSTTNMKQGQGSELIHLTAVDPKICVFAYLAVENGAKGSCSCES